MRAAAPFSFSRATVTTPVLHGLQAARPVAAAVDRLVARELHQPPHEAPVVGLALERPVQAGRGDLEGVGAVDRVLGVQDGGDLFRDRLQLVQPDPALLVHEEAHEMAPAFTLDLDVHELETAAVRRPARPRSRTTSSAPCSFRPVPSKKKSGASPLRCITPSWNSKDNRASCADARLKARPRTEPGPRVADRADNGSC